MKKIIALLMALVLVLGLTACGGNAAEADTFKVGAIYINSKNDTAGYTFAHHNGITTAMKELGLDVEKQLVIVDEVPEDKQKVLDAVDTLVGEGADIVFGISFGYIDALEEAAATYPDVIFSHGTGYKANETNFNNYFGRIYEARYLAGIAAGLRTENNYLGYVAAMQIPECIYSMNAYFLGAKSVNPDVKMDVVFTNTWYDPTIERQAAVALLDKGVDMMAQHQDTTNPVAAAEEYGVWACGYNADMTEAGPNAHLTAPVWNWGAYVTATVQQVIDGTWVPENSLMGMAEGLVDIAPLTKNVAEGTAEAIDAARAAILDGTLNVFTGPIYDNEGNLRVEEGQILTPEEILQIDWFVEGITVV